MEKKFENVKEKEKIFGERDQIKGEVHQRINLNRFVGRMEKFLKDLQKNLRMLNKVEIHRLNV